MRKKIILAIALIGILNYSCEQDQLDTATTTVEEKSILNSDDRVMSLQNYTGQGTFYTPTGLGNCSEAYPVSNMYAAMNKTQYDNSNACGSYVEITRKGTTKKVIVKILDQCPECPVGNIDLSKQAFLKLGTVAEGRIPITWKYIPQPGYAKIKVRVKTGSSRYYFSLQILDHRYMIKKVEIKNKNGFYISAPRQPYNYFLDSNGVFDGSGPDGPYNIKITDIYNQIVYAKVQLKVNVIQYTTVQFPIIK